MQIFTLEKPSQKDSSNASERKPTSRWDESRVHRGPGMRVENVDRKEERPRDPPTVRDALVCIFKTNDESDVLCDLKRFRRT